MRRGPKPTKGNLKPDVPQKLPNGDGAKVRDLEKQLAEALRDKAEALGREVEALSREEQAQEQQTATAEILRLISRSPTDIQSVFETVLQRAVRLCAAGYAALFRFDGTQIHLAAAHNLPSDDLESVSQEYPMSPTSGKLSGRAILSREVAQVADILADPDYRPTQQALSFGVRSILAVPMVRSGDPVGAILIYRREVGLFPDKQVMLLQTFADQAVIAIENVRLFNETKEALDQQTATADILKVISSSPTDVQPVFDAVAESAARLTATLDVAVFLRDGDGLRLAAHHGPIPVRSTVPLIHEEVTGRAVLDGQTVHVADLQSETVEFPGGSDNARRLGLRTVLSVPLVREGGIALGTINLRRAEVLLFTERQVALLQTFADQAVIAIENARLFNVTKEALEQQTATAEILRVISSSPTDVQPVFEAIAASAVRLCGAVNGAVFRFDGELIHIAAYHNISGDKLGPWRRQYPATLESRVVTARAILSRAAVQVEDLTNDPWLAHTPVAQAGYRTVLSVPMMRDGLPIGAVNVTRMEVRPFSPNQVALLQTFADQAVIAIENVRLFTELQSSNGDLTAALEQQTATSEILRVIAGSPTDLQPVLDALVESAGRLCEATDTFLLLVEGDQLRVAALHGAVSEGARISNTIQRGWVAGRAVIDARTVHVEDLANATADFPLGAAIATRLGHRTALAIPLLRKGVPIGALFLRRREVRQFSDAERALLQTFADQAVIAIENVRLFRELEAANRELSAASQHKSEFLASMSHELRTPLNAIMGFSEALSERMFGELNEKQAEYLTDINTSGAHLLSLINDILDLSKIEAGRMELEVSEFDLPTALDNALMLVRERAQRRSLTLHKDVDAGVGQTQGDERKIRQVVLNLLSNAIKFTPEGGRIELAAILKDGLVEVSVSDTGIGIASEDQEKVFEEFRQVGTADKKAEGTGLGLTLCRKFIELHGGKIWVKSQVGQGSTFTFTVPVRRGE